MLRRGFERFVPILSALALFACAAPDFRTSPTAERTPNGPTVSLAALRADTLVTDDGTKLPLRVWAPPAGTPVRAAVVAVHGFNDYSLAFEAPAKIWAASGIVTYAYDQRGFGANKDAGRWPGADSLVEDFRTSIRLVRARYPGIPVIGVGESMGGAVILGSMDHGSRPDRVVLAAPAVWARQTMSLTTRVALWIGARLMPEETFTGRGMGVQASDNIPMLRQLGRDPLFIKATRVDALYGLTDLMDEALAGGRENRAPTLLLYGCKDQLIPGDATALLDGELPADRTRLAVYPEGWHLLFRDLEGDTVAGDVATWILDPAAPLPSGADQGAGARLATLAR